MPNLRQTGSSGSGGTNAVAADETPTVHPEGELITQGASSPESAESAVPTVAFDDAFETEQEALENKLSGDDSGFATTDLRLQAITKGVDAMAVSLGDEAASERDVAFDSAGKDALKVSELVTQRDGTAFNERTASKWGVEEKVLTNKLTGEEVQRTHELTGGRVATDAVEFDEKKGEFVKKKNGKDLEDKDVAGFLRGMVPGFDRMSEGQQKALYDHVLQQGDDRLAQINYIFETTNGFEVWPEDLYAPGLTDDGSRQGKVEDQSDIPYLQEHLDRDNEAYDDAVAFYKELRAGKLASPADRWNFVHNFIAETQDPARLLDLKPESATGKDGEPQESSRWKSDPKAIEDSKKLYRDEVGTGLFDKASEEVERLASEYNKTLKSPDGQKQAAYLGIAEETSRRNKEAKARAESAEAYATAYHDGDLTKLDAERAKITETTKAVDTALQTVAKTDQKDWDQAKKDALSQYNTIAEEYRRTSVPALRTQLDESAKTIWGEEVAKLAPHTALMNALEAEDAALKALTDKGKYESLDALDADIAKKRADLASKREGLSNDDATKLENPDTANSHLASLKQRVSDLDEEIRYANGEATALDASTGLNEAEKAYNTARAGYSDLATAAEKGDVRGVREAYKKVTGEEPTVAVNKKSLTPAGEKKRDEAKTAQRKRTTDGIEHAETLVGVPGKAVKAGSDIMTGADGIKTSAEKLFGLDKLESGLDRLRQNRKAIADKLTERMTGRRTDMNGWFKEMLQERAQGKEKQTKTAEALYKRANGDEIATRKGRVEQQRVTSWSDESNKKRSEKAEADKAEWEAQVAWNKAEKGIPA